MTLIKIMKTTQIQFLIMRYIAVLLCGYGIVSALEKQEPDPSKILECNAVFEARKSEIQDSLTLLNERMQGLEAYRNATQNLLDQRESKIKSQEVALEEKIKQIQDAQKKEAQRLEGEKKNIQDLIAQNEALLKSIQTASNNKVAKTFSGMKDSKAAPIIAELEDSEAAEILTSLAPSEMAKILAKMDPKRAAELTKVITKGPPFKTTNTDKPTQDNADNQTSQESQKQQLNFQNNGGV